MSNQYTFDPAAWVTIYRPGRKRKTGDVVWQVPGGSDAVGPALESEGAMNDDIANLLARAKCRWLHYAIWSAGRIRIDKELLDEAAALVQRHLSAMANEPDCLLDKLGLAFGYRDVVKGRGIFPIKEPRP